jgi:hypothetical protein
MGYAQAKIRELEERGDTWSFKFAPEDDHTFQWVLQGFKYVIPLEDREWRDSDKRWVVRRTPENEKRLMQLFSNFCAELQSLRNQLPLF